MKGNMLTDGSAFRAFMHETMFPAINGMGGQPSCGKHIRQTSSVFRDRAFSAYVSECCSAFGLHASASALRAGAGHESVTGGVS